MQIWIILIGLPKLFDTYFSVMLVFVPDLSILLLISVVVLLSWNVIRLLLATQIRPALSLPRSRKTIEAERQRPKT